MNDKRLVKMLKALSNPNRLKLFEEIRGAGETAYEGGHGCFLNQVIEHLKIGAPTVSHHLKELVNAGLVVTEKQGKWIFAVDGHTDQTEPHVGADGRPGLHHWWSNPSYRQGEH